MFNKKNINETEYTETKYTETVWLYNEKSKQPNLNSSDVSDYPLDSFWIANAIPLKTQSKIFKKSKPPILFPPKRNEPLGKVGAAGVLSGLLIAQLRNIVLSNLLITFIEFTSVILVVSGILLIILGFIKVVKNPKVFKNKFWNYLFFWSLLLIPLSIVAFFAIFILNR
jgi:hypothetical protein